MVNVSPVNFTDWRQHNDEAMPNQQHKPPKFSAKEIKCLITLYDQHKALLGTDPKAPALRWASISRTISAKNGTVRSAEECRQKWRKFCARAIEEEAAEKEAAQNGGSFSKSQFAHIVLKVERAAVAEGALDWVPDEFWDSLEDVDDGGCDEVKEEEENGSDGAGGTNKMDGFVEDGSASSSLIGDGMVAVKEEPISGDDEGVGEQDVAMGNVIREQENGEFIITLTLVFVSSFCEIGGAIMGGYRDSIREPLYTNRVIRHTKQPCVAALSLPGQHF